MYVGSSAAGCVHATKNGFLRESLISNLVNCASRKANSMYASVGNFRAIKIRNL
jgi:hypothetical protein